MTMLITVVSLSLDIIDPKIASWVSTILLLSSMYPSDRLRAFSMKGSTSRSSASDRTYEKFVRLSTLTE